MPKSPTPGATRSSSSLPSRTSTPSTSIISPYARSSVSSRVAWLARRRQRDQVHPFVTHGALSLCVGARRGARRPDEPSADSRDRAGPSSAPARPGDGVLRGALQRYVAASDVLLARITAHCTGEHRWPRRDRLGHGPDHRHPARRDSSWRGTHRCVHRLESGSLREDHRRRARRSARTPPRHAGRTGGDRFAPARHRDRRSHRCRGFTNPVIRLDPSAP